MPAGLLPDEGIGAQLDYILRAAIPGVLPWSLLLWVNDLVPGTDTVLSDLEEATWGGYSRRTLDRSQWTVPAVTEGCAVSTYTTIPQVYYISGDVVQTNYGAALVDDSMGVLRWVQRFDPADIAPIELGGKFQILPRYTLTSATCGTMSARRRTRRRA